MHSCLGLILSFLFSASAVAGVTEKHSTQTYEVVQQAGTSLLDAINKASTIRQDGKTFHGYTTWYVAWNFRWNTLSSGQCVITSVNTTVSTNIILPSLRRNANADLQQFDPYIAALTRHEEGHKQFGIDAAKEVDQAILNLEPRANCKQLEIDANNTGRRILERFKALEVEYDKTTKHGCTQGACLRR